MKIGILGLQGDLSEIEQSLSKTGGQAFIIKERKDFDKVEGLILPGGETHTLNFLFKQKCILENILSFTKPILALGSSMAFLSKHKGEITSIRTLDVNMEGFSSDCYEDKIYIAHVGEHIPVAFIRPPQIKEVGECVEVLAKHHGRVVMMKENNIIACSFYPTLVEDHRIISYFMALIC